MRNNKDEKNSSQQATPEASKVKNKETAKDTEPEKLIVHTSNLGYHGSDKEETLNAEE